MKIQFIVEYLPPKKDGANSMWGKPLETKRLAALRQAALQALSGQLPLQINIKLSLKLLLPVNTQSIGDLDTFVTGVCDGLMKSDSRSKLHEETWGNPEYRDVHPDKVIAIVDDSQVISIQAEKIIDNTDHQWYEVILEGE
ncbi:hypothetical protein ACFLUD_03425 [Chloroflexota bacterium]